MSEAPKKDLKVVGQSLRFSKTPQTEPEAQSAVREFAVRSPAGYQQGNTGAGGLANELGTLPAILQYGSTAGEMANARRGACAACVAEGTLVFSDGRLIPIEKMVERTGRQTFIDGRWVDVAAHAYTGMKEVVEVRTTHGAKFTVTPDHRVMTDRGWVAACDLRSAFRPGGINDNRDLLDAPIEYELSKKNQITPEDAFFAGMLTGDGWIAHRHGDVIGVGFCYADDMSESWAPMLAYAAERLGSREQPRSDFGTRNSSLVRARTQPLKYVTWRSKEAVTLGHWLDKSHVPGELWSSTPEAIGAYLTGLFSTDGSIGFHPSPSAYFHQTSTSLVEEVRLLLRTLGIYSTVYVQIRAPRYKNLYTLAVSRQASLERFVERIGFFDDHRQIPLEEAVRARRGKDKKSPERVKSVIPAGFAKVYDISVPGPDAFLANGVRVHNCSNFDVKAWRKYLSDATNPGSTPEMRQTIATFKARIAMAGYGYEKPDGTVDIDGTLAAHGICRVLSDWVESIKGKDPVFWPVVPWREATCPPSCRAGASELQVVTAEKPLGFYVPKDLDAKNLGGKRYDEVLRLAQGKK